MPIFRPTREAIGLAIRTLFTTCAGTPRRSWNWNPSECPFPEQKTVKSTNGLLGDTRWSLGKAVRPTAVALRPIEPTTPCVDVVDDDRGMLVQELKQPTYYNTCKRNAKSIQLHSRTRTGSGSASASNMTSSTSDAGDNTINNNYYCCCCCCRQQYT